MNFSRLRKMTAILIIILLTSSYNIAFAHEGEGDPILANVEILDKEIVPDEQVELRFKLFNMKAVEGKTSDNPDLVVSASVSNGEQTIEIKSVKSGENEFTGMVVFPSAGTWKLKAHLQKAGTELQEDHDESSVYTTDIKVESPAGGTTENKVESPAGDTTDNKVNAPSETIDDNQEKSSSGLSWGWMLGIAGALLLIILYLRLREGSKSGRKQK